jgi:hypothetical protein
LYARLSFWYHLPFSEIDSMPLAAIAAYMQELPGLLAERQLQMLTATLMPYNKPAQRKRDLRQLQRLALGDDEPQRVAASPGMLAMIGIAIVRET